MVQVARRRSRGFALHFVMGAVILISLQAIVYILILDDTVGGVSFDAPDVPPPPELNVAVFRSDATAGQWQSSEGYDARVGAWTALLEREEIPHRVVSEAELSASLEASSVLVLPGVSCLGDAERRGVEAFLARGGGVVASGPLGARDGECAWRGWDFLTGLTGAREARTVRPEESTFATFRGGLFYGRELPAGYRLDLPRQELPILYHRTPDAFWSDWRLRPARGREVAACTLATHRTHAGGGRSVWFGFEETPFGREKEAQETLEGYMGAAVAWAGRRPVAALGSWPEAAPSAAMLAVVADEIAPARDLGLLATARGLPVTFGVHPAAAEGAASLAEIGEVAALGDAAALLAGRELDWQIGHVREARRAVEEAAGTPVAGFWPAEGVTDHLTPRALDEAGLAYSVGDVADIRGTPEIVRRESLLFPRALPGVVRLFRAAHDDLEVLANVGGLTPADAPLADGFLSDLERLHYLGGLYPLVLRTGLLRPDQQRELLDEVGAALERQGSWAATGEELARWWALRSQLQVRVSLVSPYRLQLDVSNHGQVAVRGVSADVYLPHRPGSVEIRSPVFRLRPPRYRLLDGEPVLRVELDELPRQTNYSYLVVLDD